MPVMIMSGALEQLVRPSSTFYLPLWHELTLVEILE